MTLKSYALSIAVMVMITQIIEMLMVKGTMKKSVEMVLSLVVTMVFASPILSMFSADFSVDNLFNDSEVTIDENFLYYVEEVRSNSYEEKVIECLEEKGYYGCEVKVDVESLGEIVIIKKVEINLKNLVIIEEQAHINKTELTLTVSSKLNIDAGSVSLIE